MKKFAIVPLGCPRNLVDSEVIAGYLEAKGYKSVKLEDGADVAIVNTCAFVASAREESVDAIIEAGQFKKDGHVKYLVVCGCLPQLYKKKLADELPEVDLILGTSDFPRIVELLAGLEKRGGRVAVTSDLKYIYDENSPRSSFTPGHYAYVKISEGCSNSCSYCIISRLRGELRSRRLESVMEEVRSLSGDGRVKEIELIGQDTTRYGADLYGKPMLSELLRSLCKLQNEIRWIRLLYTHPAHYTDELIDTIASEDKICKYIDLPIQHISGKVLRLMNRGVTKKEIIGLINKLRKRIPGLILRTSVIVGFPNETEKDFKELMDFINTTGFDRLGAFMYSAEELTAASRLKFQIDDAVKRTRYDEVMKLQQSISARLMKKFIGKTVDVLIDERVPMEDNKFVGRTEGDSPDIDGVVYVTSKKARVGEFCKVKITDTLEYDRIGEC